MLLPQLLGLIENSTRVAPLEAVLFCTISQKHKGPQKEQAWRRPRFSKVCGFCACGREKPRTLHNRSAFVVADSQTCKLPHVFAARWIQKTTSRCLALQVWRKDTYKCENELSS